MQQAFTTEYANVHRGLHYLANAATEAYEAARSKVAAYINARRMRMNHRHLGTRLQRLASTKKLML